MQDVVGPRRNSKGVITANPSSSRWVSGKFVCTVCSRDCGYRQNLFFHMKKHEKYGENIAVRKKRKSSSPEKAKSPKMLKKEIHDAFRRQQQEEEGVEEDDGEEVGENDEEEEVDGGEDDDNEDEIEYVPWRDRHGVLKMRRKRWVPKKGRHVCDECGKDCRFADILQVITKMTIMIMVMVMTMMTFSGRDLHQAREVHEGCTESLKEGRRRRWPR